VAKRITRMRQQIQRIDLTDCSLTVAKVLDIVKRVCLKNMPSTKKVSKVSKTSESPILTIKNKFEDSEA
jgi:hypothetical protein